MYIPVSLPQQLCIRPSNTDFASFLSLDYNTLLSYHLFPIETTSPHKSQLNVLGISGLYPGWGVLIQGLTEGLENYGMG